MDQDGGMILEARQSFELASTSVRQYNINLVTFPLHAGVITMTIGRGDEELLRQDFTIEVQPFPGT